MGSSRRCCPLVEPNPVVAEADVEVSLLGVWTRDGTSFHSSHRAIWLMLKLIVEIMWEVALFRVTQMIGWMKWHKRTPEKGQWWLALNSHKLNGDSQLEYSEDRATPNIPDLTRAGHNPSPSSGVLHELKVGSDHCLLLVKCRVHLKKVPFTFKFESKWSTHIDCAQVIGRAWSVPHKGSDLFGLAQKLKKCKQALLDWSVEARDFSRVLAVMDNCITEEMNARLIKEVSEEEIKSVAFNGCEWGRKSSYQSEQGVEIEGPSVPLPIRDNERCVVKVDQGGQG
ncbi:hypothetical protein RHSIM_Rhsim11G0070900 [Rhododendron simsii]|uniref:Uncharacterized protein n=1 Tax=Rhododendron simsii TaxID=118357 RepID=A0A834G807_RHOSS|nr:hypothetical protein RHSIM_Rhsim11G0070900 [Rhododendron simsii]